MNKPWLTKLWIRGCSDHKFIIIPQQCRLWRFIWSALQGVSNEYAIHINICTYVCFFLWKKKKTTKKKKKKKTKNKQTNKTKQNKTKQKTINIWESSNLVVSTYRVMDKKYSWLSLSRSRLSRITAYLEVKIWSLPKDENLATGNKILWKRSNFSSFPQYFQYISNFKSRITYTFVKCGCSIYFSSILQFWYVEVRISRSISESPLEFEITRVESIYFT